MTDDAQLTRYSAFLRDMLAAERQEWKRTDRGFGCLEFEDRYRQRCSLQESSLASEPAIWLGVVNTGPHMQPPNQDIMGRMHLTQEQVRTLLPALIRFAETGELAPEEEEEEHG